MEINCPEKYPTTSPVSLKPACDHKFKLMMLGDAGVGKTSIARRFVDDAFLTTYIHTIGIDFLEKMVECDRQTIKLQIWDTAGQDRFRTLVRPYYRGAAGMVLAYDVTDEKTFQNVEDWMRCIVENTQEFQIIQKVLLANKTDLSPDLHRVTAEEGRQLAAKHGVELFEVSAKEGTGIPDAFLHLTRLVLRAQSAKQRRRSTWSNSSGNDDEDVIVLQDIPVHAKKERKCCK